MGKDVIIALDFDSREKTLAFLDRFAGEEQKPFVKIGMELYYAEGPAIVREVKARGAVVLGLCTEEFAGEMKEVADWQFCVPKTPDFMLPSMSILPLQLFAYYVASMKGCDIDKPRNLAKSVTVE